jgi:hypothetical protein
MTRGELDSHQQAKTTQIREVLASDKRRVSTPDRSRPGEPGYSF